MNPRLRGRPAFQQQVQFSGKVKPDARQRHIRLLADRPSGRIAIIVDGVLVSQVGPKSGEEARDLGRGLMLIPQPSMPCTFSNFWIGPWNGQIPGNALRPESSLPMGMRPAARCERLRRRRWFLTPKPVRSNCPSSA